MKLYAPKRPEGRSIINLGGEIDEKNNIFLLFFMYGCACTKDRGRQIYVPNADTAIAIAEAIAIPIYGRDTVNAIRHFLQN